MDDEGVFDAYPAPARQVDPGLDGERHVGPNATRGAGVDPGRLVDDQPDPVAQAVGEVRFEAGRPQGAARRRIEALAANPLADAELAARTAACAERLVAAVVSRGDGIPTHWRLDGDGRPFAVHREANTAAACFALDALPADRRADVLARSAVRRAMAEVLAADDPDLPTTLTLAARSDWVWR